MHITSSRIVVAAVATFLLASTAGDAGAVHWPNFGGDAGRSGYQPVDEVGTPVAQTYKTLGGSSADIETSPITTTGGGDEAQALIAFGTLDHLHHRLLTTGAPRGAEQDIDDVASDGDTFGAPGTRASVTPVESSTASSAGITFAVHNDDNQNGAEHHAISNEPDPRTGADIAIALVDQAGGFELADQAIGPVRPSTTVDRARANTIGFTISSSPVITAAAPDGRRSIFFVATRPAGQVNPQTFSCSPGTDFEVPPGSGGESTRGCSISPATRLFKVVISDANTINANFNVDDVFAVDVPSANGEASPALINIGADAHVAVGTTDGYVRTYRASDLMPGPASGDLGDAVFTPSVPVRSDGFIPAPATELFVAALRPDADPDASRVYRLSAAAGGLSVDEQSPNLAGEPAPALAVTREHDSIVPGRVLFTTSRNLYSLNTADLGDGTQFDLVGALAPGTSGFSRTTAAASGELAFVTNDQGDQLVLDAVTLERVTAADFTPDSGSTPAANEGIGQPSVSRRFVQFTTADGLFVYRGAKAPVPGAESTFFSVDDVSVQEGDAGTTTATFTVRKSGPAAASVDVATADGTVVAGDYAARTQTLTFGAGEGTRTFGVTINGDVADEPDEIFKVILSGATGGTSIADAEGTGLILDDDPEPQLEALPLLLVSDAVAVEGGDATFTVSLSRPGAAPVTAVYATRDDSARAGADYSARTGTLRFEPGETTKAVVVPVLADPDDEQPERFRLELTEPSGATAGDMVGTGTIIDADGPPPVVSAVDPAGLTVAVRPKRDARAPHRFTTTGQLRLPSGISPADGCAGRVSVQVKASRKTISTRRAPIRADCSYRVVVSFANSRRFTRRGILKFTVRYLGTARVRKFTAPSKLVRVR